jgi:hypothetical protein
MWHVSSDTSQKYEPEKPQISVEGLSCGLGNQRETGTVTRDSEAGQLQSQVSKISDFLPAVIEPGNDPRPAGT